jgi:holo-[acyl-carrier protein] synthase
MINKIGIGIDIVDVKRFKKIPYEEKPSFYKRIFFPSEIKYCLKHKNSFEHFAGKFAIKEATIKSIQEKISILELETVHLGSKPEVRIKGKLGKKYKFLVSVSHEKQFAIAVVISEKI